MNFKIKCANAVLIAVASLATFPALSIAQQPPADLRWFAELIPAGMPCVDWESVTSKRIVSHADGNQADEIQFATVDWVNVYPHHVTLRDEEGNIIFDFEGTKWVQKPVIHVSTTGVETISHVYWLVDGDTNAPQAGTTGRTGPDGDVAVFAAAKIGRFTGGGINAEKFILSPYGTMEICLSAGDFER